MSHALPSRNPNQRLIRAAFLALPVVALAALGACTEAPQQSRSEQSQNTACREMADRIVKQNNVTALSQANLSTSPFAAGSTLTAATDQLSIEHQRQDILNDCLRHYDSYAPNQGAVTATPSAATKSEALPPPPADLAGPTGSDLTRPPILPAAK